MRQSEKPCMEFEFPGRYALDEARFIGGRDRVSHSSRQEAKT